MKGTSLRIDHKSGKNWGTMSSMLSLSWLEPENPGSSQSSAQLIRAGSAQLETLASAAAGDEDAAAAVAYV